MVSKFYSKLLAYIETHNSFCSLDFNILGFQNHSEALIFLKSLQSFGNIFIVNEINNCSWGLTDKGKDFIQNYNSINRTSENKDTFSRDDSLYDILIKIDNEKVYSIEESVLKKYAKNGYIRNSEIYVLEVTKGDGFSKNLKLADELTVDMIKLNSWNDVTFCSYNFNQMGNAEKYGSFHVLYDFINEVRHGLFELGFIEVVVNSFLEKHYFKSDIVGTLEEELDCIYSVTLKDNTDQAMIKNSNQEKKSTTPHFLRSTLFHGLLFQISALKPESCMLFTLGKVFKNNEFSCLDVPEFHALEIMVSGSNLDLSNILGICFGLFSRLNITSIDFKQAYFPHTAPTVGVYLYNEVLDTWISVGEGGIIRPELMKKLGFKENDMILRLGFSLERVLMNKEETDDINKLLSYEGK